MNQAQPTQEAQPAGWLVVISVTNIETGQIVPVARHSCSDVLQAKTMLAEIREVGDDLFDLLPGITAAGYELLEPLPVPALRTFAEAMESSTLDEGLKAYWRQEIAKGDFLGPA